VDPLLRDRPVEIHAPPNYQAGVPTPLLILLHGYTLNGAKQEQLFGLSKTASEQGFLYAAPDGTVDELKQRFWNATDGCCNLSGSNVDDVAYLHAVIQDAKKRFNVDPKRVYFAGYSNGGFMSYRMACEHADEIAGIVSLAGGTWTDGSRCKPSSSVAVLQVHGDMDTIIKYEGGLFAKGLSPYPSARETVAQWARNEGCTGLLADTGTPLDLDDGVMGAETKVERYAGCPGPAVELWTLRGSGHFPELPSSWGTMIYKFLQANPKP